MSINELLEIKQITKYKQSTESGVPHATLNDIYSGRSNISECSADTIYKISHLLEM